VLAQLFSRLPVYHAFLEAVVQERWRAQQVPLAAQKDKLVLSEEFYEQVRACVRVCVGGWGAVCSPATAVL
jgi:hypothetical protein